jgi:23S rRNA pseudouridine1911/1915/1917 synthase
MDGSVFQHSEVVRESEAGVRLDFFLVNFPFPKFKESFSPSRSAIQKWIADGCVKINSLVVKSKSYHVKAGDRIDMEVSLDHLEKLPQPEALDIHIVYQDKQIIVLDKPVGISSHPTESAMGSSVVNFLYHLKIDLPPTSHPLRPGIVHRLDKNTSGLMVVALTDQSVKILFDMIMKREVERTYLAIVFGNPPANDGTIDAPIGRHEVDRKKMAVSRIEQGRPARTHYKVLKRYPGFSLVECKLDTGRTHQIRVHMSHIGYPVAGDPLYGGRKAHDRVERTLKESAKHDEVYEKIKDALYRIADIINSDDVHLLHATCLSFVHPITGEKLCFHAEPHAKFAQVLELLNSLPHENIKHAV